MSFSFLEGVDFSCSLVLAEDNGLQRGGCQLGGGSCAPSPGAAGTNLLLTLVSQEKCLKLAQESSAEAGVSGSNAWAQLKHQTCGLGSSPEGQGRLGLWFLPLLARILLLGEQCGCTHKKEDPKDRGCFPLGFQGAGGRYRRHELGSAAVSLKASLVPVRRRHGSRLPAAPGP